MGLWLEDEPSDEYICTAHPGSGNSAIARRVFRSVANETDVKGVVVMWSFLIEIRLGHAQTQGSRGHTLGDNIALGHHMRQMRSTMHWQAQRHSRKHGNAGKTS